MVDARKTSESAAIFRRFVAAINDHDPTALAALMTPDHAFVDSLGNRMQGAAAVEAAWRGYFSMCRDYRIHVDDVLSDGDLVLAIGQAGGTIDGTAWKTPAAWKAVIRGGTVAEWRVFADNKPVYEILAKRKA